MKYDGDGRATARFFPVKDVAGLFLLRRLTRRGRNAACGQCPASGRARRALYRSRLASVTVYASPSPFLMNALRCFRGIFSPSKDDGCDIPRSA